ncbi:hypothetical protein DL96DRAFT_1580027 [Flagelloscypha sp. PMI_526]|nr:hypothetical protein DL96DRAFT_1580027 [Flagelloscypha sp. PMI_526]
MDTSNLLDFVKIINKTPHVSHLTWTLINSPLPADAFPASVRRLDVYFLDFHPFSWNTTQSFPSSVNIEILQIASGIDWETPLIQHISLVPFTSLKYLHLHSGLSIRLSGLNTWLSAVLVPQFPASLRVCLIYDPVYTGNRFISREMKALILGDVDDRILVCTDDRIRVSPRGVLHNYLIRWYNDVVPTFIDPFPALSNVSNPNPRNNPDWKELELLVQRRRAQREKWL